MFNPFKTIKAEITATVAVARIFREAYNDERRILASQAKIAETTHVPGYTNIYA